MKEKTVGINQPYYLPYIGFFERVKACDVFIINEYSSLNYERANHRRVRITQQHPTAPLDSIFLTQNVGARSEGKSFDQIDLPNSFWERQKMHGQTLYGTYKKAPHFGYMQDLLPLLSDHAPISLAEYNLNLILFLARKLGLCGKIIPIRSLSEIDPKECLRNNRDMQLNSATYTNLYICKKTQATVHIAGQNAPLWLDERTFKGEGILVRYQWVDFKPYPQYSPKRTFVPGLSVVDLLFNTGEQAKNYIGANSLVVDRDTLIRSVKLSGR